MIGPSWPERARFVKRMPLTDAEVEVIAV